MKEEIWRWLILFIIFFLIIYLINHLLKKIPDREINIQSLDEKTKIKFLLFNKVIEKNLSYNDYIILLKIAYAESCLNHFDKNYSILRGKYNSFDKGLFQINEKYHFVGDSLEENIEYAVNLYIKDKTRHWSYSKKNWNKSIDELKKMCH